MITTVNSQIPNRLPNAPKQAKSGEPNIDKVDLNSTPPLPSKFATRAYCKLSRPHAISGAIAGALNGLLCSSRGSFLGAVASGTLAGGAIGTATGLFAAGMAVSTLKQNGQNVPDLLDLAILPASVGAFGGMMGFIHSSLTVGLSAVLGGGPLTTVVVGAALGGLGLGVSHEETSPSPRR